MMPSPVRWSLCLLVLLTGCDSGQSRPGGGSQAAPTATVGAARAVPAGPDLLRAPAGVGVATWVKAETARAAAEGRPVVVYVGAKWCEPCKHFHEALEHGKLDGLMPPARFLEFDLDEARDQLEADGYGSRMIPLFVVPDAAGRGTERRMAGSIKGSGAVGEITPRLIALLGSGV